MHEYNNRIGEHNKLQMTVDCLCYLELISIMCNLKEAIIIITHTHTFLPHQLSAKPRSLCRHGNHLPSPHFPGNSIKIFQLLRAFPVPSRITILATIFRRGTLLDKFFIITSVLEESMISVDTVRPFS